MLTVADTAYSIAVIRAEEGERPPAERLFEDPFAAIFAAAGAHAAEGTKRYLELPFFRDGIRLRTRYLDDFVREGLAAGIDQLVLLGAGFDTRALRMPAIESRDATVYEVDFAAQLAHKRRLLAAAGVTLPARVVHVACDFAEVDFDARLEADLVHAGFRSGAGALFVWEGVIGYIDDATIGRTLAFMARAGGAGSRAAYNYGEGSFGAGGAHERTARAGFSACEEVACDELWRRLLPGEPHPNASFVKLGTAVV